MCESSNETAVSLLERAVARLEQVSGTVRAQAAEASGAVKQHVQEHPVQTAAIAGLVGVALGILMSRR